MWALLFWKAIFERAVKTFVEAWAAALTTGAVGLHNADWLGSLSIAGMATLIAVLLNIGVSIGTNGTPSVGNVERLDHRG